MLKLSKKISANSQNNAPILQAKKELHSYRPAQLFFLRLWANKLAIVGLMVVLLMMLISIAAPLLAPYDPTYIDTTTVLKPPSAQHIFGTDDLGRDVFSRVLYGGRESIRVGFLGILIGITGGLIVGVFSGYTGGWVDMLIQRILEIFMAFPMVLLLLCIVAAMGPSLTTILIALGLSSIPGFSRLVRGSVLAVKNMEYVTSAKVIGAQDGRIMWKYIIPNILGPILVYTTLGLGSAIMMTAGLSYIGLGAQPPSAEWGAMLNYGRRYLQTAWWLSIWPGLSVFLIVLSINLFGDGLRDAFDPKTS